MSDASSNLWQQSRRLGTGTTPALFERAPQPIAAVGGSNAPTIEVVNRAYAERFGSHSAEDTPLDDGSARRELSATERSVVRRAANGTVAVDSLTKLTTDGYRSFVVRAVPTSRDDVTAFVQYRDVTTRRIRDQQLAVLRRVLRHDLRNDLTVLLGYAEAIVDTTDDPAIREQATTVLDAAEDLRTVADSASHMQCVTDAADSTTIEDATAVARRTIEPSLADAFTVDGPVPARTVDDRVGIALEELCGVLAERGHATTIDVSAETADCWATIAVEADGTLPEEEYDALRGRDETQLRHARGIAAWTTRWAVRAAGGRVRVARHEGERCRIELVVPCLEVTSATDAPTSITDD